MTAFIWFTVSGCITTVRFPPDLWAWDSGGNPATDSGLPITEPTLTEPIRAWGVSGGCDVDHTAFTYVAVTTGWVAGGRFNVFRTGDGTVEEHFMGVIRSDPNGGWDELQVGPLVDGVDPVDQQTGVDTRFDCEVDMPALSFTVRIHDGLGVLLDCIVWGADPMAATASIRNIDPGVLALGGCRLIQP